MDSMSRLLFPALVSSAYAGYSGNFDGSYSGSGWYPYDGNNGDDGNGDGDSSSQFSGSNLEQTQTIRIAHGVLASAAFVFFFPVGGIAIRIIPHRAAIWIHALFQIFAYVLYIAAFGLGIWMVERFEMLDSSATNYHPIIGIVLFTFLFFQPILGLLHHTMFKKHQRRQIWSYAHLWLGRILITLGIINGGLGFMLADNSLTGEIVYGVVAGVIWLIWITAAVYGEVKRAKTKRHADMAGIKHYSNDSGESATSRVAPDAAYAPDHAPAADAPPKYQ